MSVEVPIVRLDPEIPLPSYAHHGDAGADLCSVEDVTIQPGQRVLVGTGVALALPEGFAGFVHPRSGLAARSGLTIVNAPGTLDAGYRGEIKVCLLNTDGTSPCHIARGDRIAQLIVQRVETVTFVERTSLDETVRGSGGHGSSGGVASWEASTSCASGAPTGDNAESARAQVGNHTNAAQEGSS